MFLDEVDFSLKGTVRRTWRCAASFGQASWDKGSTIGAITRTGQFSQHTRHGAFKGTDVIHFVQHVLTHVPGEVVVVLDNAGIHKSKAVAGESCLSLRYLPPYSPELNPIELVWVYVKRNVLGNFCADVERTQGAPQDRVATHPACPTP